MTQAAGGAFTRKGLRQLGELLQASDSGNLESFYGQGTQAAGRAFQANDLLAFWELNCKFVFVVLTHLTI